MHPRTILALTAALACVASSQQSQVDRVLHFASTGTEQAVEKSPL